MLQNSLFSSHQIVFWLSTLIFHGTESDDTNGRGGLMEGLSFFLLYSE